jgi:hypothetical protein
VEHTIRPHFGHDRPNRIGITEIDSVKVDATQGR